MIARFFLSTLALAMPAFSQPGLYGPITTHVKAGDRAPDLVFTNLLSAPVSASWSQSNLTGQLTVLAFYPDTSHNLQAVTIWNAVVDKFAAKPVQFVWITGEKEATLLPWLTQHPIKGWVLYDPKGQTGNAYSMEIPSNVIIGKDRKIVGFYDGIMETENLLNAVQEGRTTTTRPDPSNFKAFIQSGQVLLDAEPRRMPRMPDNRPPFPPSYTLHVSPSQTEERGNFGGDDFWALKGTTLKEAIEKVYEVNPIRTHLPATLDSSKRYDFVLVLPEQEDQEKMKARFQQGIQDYFHLSARRENRLVDVYLVTAAPNRKPPPHEPPKDQMGGFNNYGLEFVTERGSNDLQDETPDWTKPLSIDALRGLSLDGTADQLCRFMEAQLDRPVVNETNLPGEYEFRVEGAVRPGAALAEDDARAAKNDFLQRLRDQLGLVITPTQRNLELLVFEPR